MYLISLSQASASCDGTVRVWKIEDQVRGLPFKLFYKKAGTSQTTKRTRLKSSCWNKSLICHQ